MRRRLEAVWTSASTMAAQSRYSEVGVQIGRGSNLPRRQARGAGRHSPVQAVEGAVQQFLAQAGTGAQNSSTDAALQICRP